MLAWELDSWEAAFEESKREAAKTLQAHLHRACKAGVALDQLRTEVLYDGFGGMVRPGKAPHISVQFDLGCATLKL